MEKLVWATVLASGSHLVQAQECGEGGTVLLAPLTEEGEGLRTVMQLGPSPAPLQPWLPPAVQLENGCHLRQPCQLPRPL